MMTDLEICDFLLAYKNIEKVDSFELLLKNGFTSAISKHSPIAKIIYKEPVTINTNLVGMFDIINPLSLQETIVNFLNKYAITEKFSHQLVSSDINNICDVITYEHSKLLISAQSLKTLRRKLAIDAAILNIS